MNTIFKKKFLFQFRGEDSVKNAIPKISQLLSNYNRDTSNTTNEKIILNISGSKQSGITFYKKPFDIYDKSDKFGKSLKVVEKQLAKSFTEIRKKDLASIMEVSKDKPDIVDVTLVTPIATTVVSINLTIGEPDLPDVLVKNSKKISFKPLKIIAEGDLPLAPVSLKTPPVKRARKVIAVSTPSVEVDSNILKGITNLKEEITIKKVRASKVIPKLSKLVVPPISPVNVLGRIVGGLPTEMINLNGVAQSNLLESASWTQLLSRYTPIMDNFLLRLPNLFLRALSKEPSNYIGMAILFMFYIVIYVLYCIIGIITYIKGVPFLLSNIQDIPLFNIFQDISFDSSIFDNMFNILKNINKSVPDIFPRNY